MYPRAESATVLLHGVVEKEIVINNKEFHFAHFAWLICFLGKML